MSKSGSWVIWVDQASFTSPIVLRFRTFRRAVTFVAICQFQTSAALVLQPTKFEFVVKPEERQGGGGCSLTAAPSPSRTLSCRRHRYRTCARTSACRHRQYGTPTGPQVLSLPHRHPAHSPTDCVAPPVGAHSGQCERYAGGSFGSRCAGSVWARRWIDRWRTRRCCFHRP